MRLSRVVLASALFAAPAFAFQNAPELFAKAQEFHRGGQLAAARAKYGESAKAAQSSHDIPVRAAALLGLAQIDLSTGKYTSAISEGEDAIAALRAVRDRRTEGNALTTVGQARYFSGDTEGALRDFALSLAIARDTRDAPSEITRLNNIGGVYYSQGNFGAAFEQYREAEEKLRSAKSQTWFRSREQLTLANLAVLYQGIGEYQRALAEYRAMVPDPTALPARELGQLLANKGTLYRRLGDPVTALEEYRKAQSLYRSAALASGELSVLNNIGIDYALDLKDYPAALSAFTSGLQLALQSGAKRSAMTSLLYRGEVFLRTGKIADAHSDFLDALVLADELKAGEETWRSRYGLARVATASGDRKASDDELRKGIAAVEKMRAGTSAGSGRAGFLIERRDLYDLLIEHLAEDSRPDADELFRLMEQSRARDLQDRLHAHPLSIDQLRSELPADTLLIEYWAGQHALAAIAVSRENVGLVFERLSLPDESALHEVPALLSDPTRLDWPATARMASALLVDRIGALRNQRLRKLVIVPDAYLGRIPFEALPADNGLLIDRFSVTYLPFASIYHQSAARRLAFPWSKMLEAFANPRPAAGNDVLKLNGISDGAIPDSSREVQTVASVVGGRNQLFLGRDARKSLLWASAGTIPVLHFATHAFADQEDPERSYILFAGEKPGFDYLFLKEAEQLKNVRGSLVTVSACDSGGGRIERGEAVQSFGTAFLAAGARTVVTTLWRVGDKPSAELMTRFYQGLAAGEHASDAMRNAKLSFRRSPGSPSHPAYWAAFVVTGDGGLRLPWMPSWGLIAGAALMVAAVIGALIRTTAGRA